MVWGLFPLETLPGAQNYYIFSKGSYKVGRKDCDVVIQTDRAVSRVHAEIIIDAMHSGDPLQKRSSTALPYARVRDLSKFGTFINKESGSQPVNTLSNKEAILKDGDLLSFGTGSATCRFCFVPLIAYADSTVLEANPYLEEAISSIGSVIARQCSPECTHVIVGESTLVSGELIGSVIEQKPVVLSTWFMNLAEKKILTEIPSLSDHIPSLMLDGMPVKVVEPPERANCLQGYTFVLMQPHLYKFGSQLVLLIQLVGGNIQHVDQFPSCTQNPADGGNQKFWLVIPEGAKKAAKGFNHFTSLSRLTETKLVAAILSGNLEPYVFEPQPFSVASSQSTDETIVVESDIENDTAESSRLSAANEKEDSEMRGLQLDTSTRTEFRSSKADPCGNDADETGIYSKSDFIYSQSLIVRGVMASDSVSCPPEQSAVNFKRFRKREIVSGNTYQNLIPFSNEPYHEFDYENRDIARYMREEKILKQREAIAEDLFNTEKARKRGAVSRSMRGKGPTIN